MTIYTGRQLSFGRYEGFIPQRKKNFDGKYEKTGEINYWEKDGPVILCEKDSGGNYTPAPPDKQRAYEDAFTGYYRNTTKKPSVLTHQSTLKGEGIAPYKKSENKQSPPVITSYDEEVANVIYDENILHSDAKAENIQKAIKLVKQVAVQYPNITFELENYPTNKEKNKLLNIPIIVLAKNPKNKRIAASDMFKNLDFKINHRGFESCEETFTSLLSVVAKRAGSPTGTLNERPLTREQRAEALNKGSAVVLEPTNGSRIEYTITPKEQRALDEESYFKYISENEQEEVNDEVVTSPFDTPKEFKKTGS